MNRYASVVVPVYNEEKNLRNCFESLNAQTCRNFEAIFVDDGSTDGSWKLLQKLAKEYQNINTKLLQQSNQGAMSARKLAIENAQYEYIIYHDCDDKISPNAVQELLKPFDDMNVDATLFHLKVENEQGEFTDFEYFTGEKYLKGKDCYIHSLNGWSIHGFMCYKKSILEQANKDYQKYNPSLENWVNNDEVVTRLVFLLSNVLVRTGVVYYYKHNIQSTTKRVNNNFYKTLKNEKIIFYLAGDYDVKSNQQKIFTHLPHCLKYIFKIYLKNKNQLDNSSDWLGELRDIHLFCMKNCFHELSFKWKFQLIKLKIKLFYLNFLS